MQERPNKTARNHMKKNIILLHIFSLFIFAPTLNAGDFITIADPIPSGSGTVSGNPLVIDGTSSQANCMVRLFLNMNFIESITTDGSGNWSYALPGYINNGTYKVDAWLMTSTFSLLACNSVLFTVYNGETIAITSPNPGTPIVLNPIVLMGSSSMPNATVDISLDGNLVATTTTDTSGNWQYSYTLTAANGSHTFLIQLFEYGYGYPVASATVDIVNSIPFIFPSGTSQARFVNGDVPTSGSGSGSGYTYTVSGSTMTINFVPAFNTTPSMTTTGLRASGSSTVSLTSVSATAATLGFSSGTQVVHFSAATLQ